MESIFFDRVEKGAYSSLCYQLGSNIREIHRVLRQTLLSETNTDSIVRTLKTIELLLDNVSYNKLSPDLLTGVAQVVKNYVTHSEAVVRANALSVFVYLLLVKPAVPELKKLLTSYAAPTSFERTVLEDTLESEMLVSASSDDAGEEFFEEEDEETNLETSELNRSQLTLTKEDSKSKRHPGRSRRSFVGWLLGQCVDCLLPAEAFSRGIYVQVQLQSLKVVSALVSDHFLLVYRRLSIIQKIISEGCKQNATPNTSFTPEGNPCDSVVTEHVYPVLGALLSVVKRECEEQTKNSTLASEENEATASKSITNSTSKFDIRVESIDWGRLSITLWTWAIQDPLSELLKLPITDAFLKGDCSVPEPSPSSIWWVRSLESQGETGEVARRQLVAAANVLILLTSKVAENVGEQMLNSVLKTVLWLVLHTEKELSVWGIRLAGVLCSLEEVQRSSLGVQLVKEAVDAATSLLFIRNDLEDNDPSGVATAVNKHRLVVVSALANISATFKSYFQATNNDLLALPSVESLIETAIHACKDKSRIRPHGVRCLGSCIGWLRDIAFDSRHNSPKAVWDELSPKLCNRALDTLKECCSTGSNMKMRWNACHALGHLLHCPLPINGSQLWREPILKMLCQLVSNFHNYKVRIQACGALCCLPSRDLYSSYYKTTWLALMDAANSTQNVVDYLEMRHKDDLICQVSVLGLVVIVKTRVNKLYL